MNANDRDALFKNALEAYLQGELAVAADGFRRLVRSGSTEPKHISYCGLLVAIAEGEDEDGKVLCELAVKEGANDPEVYLNLARLHACTGSRARAIDTLRRGLRIDPNNPGLQLELSQLNRRSPPMVKSLERKHPLNRYLGLTRARISRLFGAH